ERPGSSSPGQSSPSAPLIGLARSWRLIERLDGAVKAIPGQPGPLRTPVASLPRPANPEGSQLRSPALLSASAVAAAYLAAQQARFTGWDIALLAAPRQPVRCASVADRHRRFRHAYRRECALRPGR